MSDPQSKRPASPATLVAQGTGRFEDPDGALIPPIHPSTTYIRDADGRYSKGRGYTRPGNPTYDEPQALLAQLEGGADARLFASGMAACTAVFQSLLPGDHVVAPRVMYWALRKWLSEFAVAWGLEVDFVETGDIDALAAAVQPGRTRIVWLETPANPTWTVTDIAAAAEIAHRAHARVAVDSTVATPVHTRPIEHGADLVVHSATKYLNGHSDVLAGAVVTARRDPFWERLKSWQGDGGAVPGPFEAWLLLRGMRTLFVRVARSSANALAVARWAHDHADVVAALYPGLPDHPGHNVAGKQMDDGFGGMLSIRVAGGEARAMAVAAAVRVFRRATSLGGVESLIEHRASIEGPSTPVPRDLLRLSIGIEDPADLIADLDQALAATRADAQPVEVSAPATSGPTTLAARIEGVLDANLRPEVLDRGGDIRIAGVDGDALRIELLGSPGAALPLRRHIEAVLRRELPELTRVSFGGDDSPAESAPRGPGTIVEPHAVARLLEQVINPAVAAHGGAIVIAGIEDGIVRVRLEGRCQGCGLAEVTVHQGIATLLHERIPGVRAVVDVTDHGAGRNPYYRPGKK